MRSPAKRIKLANGCYCLCVVYRVHLSNTRLELRATADVDGVGKLRVVARKMEKKKNTSLNSSALNAGTVQHFPMAFPARARTHAKTYFMLAQRFSNASTPRQTKAETIGQTARIVRFSYLNHTSPTSSASSSFSLAHVYLSSCKR